MLPSHRRPLAVAVRASHIRWALALAVALALSLAQVATAGSTHGARRHAARETIVRKHVKRYGVYMFAATITNGSRSGHTARVTFSATARVTFGTRSRTVRFGRHRRAVLRLKLGIATHSLVIGVIGGKRPPRLSVDLRRIGDLASLHPRPPAGGVVVVPANKRSASPGASTPTLAPAPAPARAPAPAPAAPSVPTAPPAGGPSGVPMPVGNIPGWTDVASDDFSQGGLDPSAWQVYDDSMPGGDPGGWWSASHVSVTNGVLQLSTYRDPSACIFGCQSIDDYVGGGLKMLHSQQYGKYLIRMRADDAEGVTMVALLWPTDINSNGEIDIAEDNGASPRTQFNGTMYTMNEVPTTNMLNVDMSQWHTVGVEWTPGRVIFTIDGTNWATVTNDGVSDVPMQLAIQQQTWDCGVSNWEQCPNAMTPSVANLDVAWVVEYAPA
jgi:hypothetical protein